MEQLEIAYALAEDQKRQHQDPPTRLPIVPLVFPGGSVPPIIQSWEPIQVKGDMDQADLNILLDRIDQSQTTPFQDIPHNINKHLKALLDEDVNSRVRAVIELGEIRDTSVIPALCYTLNDVNMTASGPDEVHLVSSRASLELAQFGEAAISCLLVALRDEEILGRHWAAQALLKIGKPSVPGLLDALRNEERPYRGAFLPLGWICDPRDVPGLLIELRDPDPDVRKNAILALGDFIYYSASDPDRLIVLLDTENDANNIRESVCKALGEMNDPSEVSDLNYFLENERNEYIRNFSTITKAIISDPIVREVLVHTLKKGSKEMRRFAATTLGHLRDPSILPDLVMALRDPDTKTAWFSASSLGRIGDSSAVPALLNALKDRRYRVRREAYRVRREAAKSLGLIGDTAAVPGLCRALWERNRLVRSSAAKALGEIGDIAAVPKLTRALWHYDSITRKKARKAISKILAN
jgi:HEAT repeat protein